MGVVYVGVESEGKPPILLRRRWRVILSLHPLFILEGRVVSKKSFDRFSLLLAALAILHVGNTVARDNAQRVSDLEFIIQDLKSERDTLSSNLVELEDTFRVKLLDIATTLYDRDYRSMGGYTTPEGESVTVLYDVILNEVRDYQALLHTLDNYFDARRNYVESVPSIWPIRYDGATRLTSGFGWRLSPITGRPHFHGGIDLTGSWNSPVLATADGVVVEHWPAPGVHGGVRFRGHEYLGGMVRLQHAGEIETVYGHMRSTNVITGQRVSRGDVIGIMGNTGMSTGTHLHYEVHVSGEPLDPIGFLRF